MTRSTLFPAAAGTDTVVNGATVVTLVFDAEGAVAAAAGPVSVLAVRIEGTDTVVIDVSAAGLRAAPVSAAARVRVAGARLFYTVPGGLPQAGGDTVLLTERRGTDKRADNSLAPAPPAALVYAERVGQTGALAMVLDGRTAHVRIEATDQTPDADRVPLWAVLRTDAAGPGALTLALTTADDAPGRRFRAVALRTVAGEAVASSPSNETYRNRPPVSAGTLTAVLDVAKGPARVSLVGLITDPDGGAITYRVLNALETGAFGVLPFWARLDGDALLVDTSAARAAASFTLLGVDEAGATATATATLTVRPSTLAPPVGVVYTP